MYYAFYERVSQFSTMKRIETSPEEAEVNIYYPLISIDKKSNAQFEKNTEKFYDTFIDTFCKKKQRIK